MTVRRALGVLTIAAALAFTSACGGGASGTADPDDAAKAAKEWLKAYDDGDVDKACEMQTQKYTDHLTEGGEDSFSLGNDCKSAVKASHELIQGFGGLGTFSTKVKASSAKTADVVMISGGEEHETYRLIWTDGKWMVDDEITEHEDEE